MDADKEAEDILERIIERKSTDFDELVENYAREKGISLENAYNIVATAIYELAGRLLISREIVEGEEGNSMILSASELGEKYVKNRKLIEKMREESK
jgi:tRNA-binding EMAP/Myf-like protein